MTRVEIAVGLGKINEGENKKNCSTADFALELNINSPIVPVVLNGKQGVRAGSQHALLTVATQSTS